MPRASDKERVGAWDKKLAKSSSQYEDWAAEYSPDLLEEYYYGKQCQDESEEWDKRKYVINMFYSSINISKPSMLFALPKYKVTPRINRSDDPLSDAQARAKLQEDTLMTEIERPRLGFAFETGLALLDAQFRCGIVQIGYTADFIDNPNADKPILKEDNQPMTDAAGDFVNQPKVQLKSEGLFMKWIPAKQFRVSTHCGNRLSGTEWCGYFEWHQVEDIQANPRYKNTAGLKANGRIRHSAKDEAQQSSDERAHAGLLKVWFIWDMRAKKRYVFQSGGEKFFLEEPFRFLPFPEPLKFDERLGKFWPLPHTYNWVHPQNELNDTREMQRIHRKRAVRRYLRRAGAILPEEFAKLCEGEDMESAEVNGDPSTAVVPMQDAPLDNAVARNMLQTHDDFTRVTGISGESQQVAQSETATQANLIALMGQTRESAKRIQVAKWLSDIGRIILLTLRDNMALSWWIRIAIDPESPFASAEAQEVTHLWKELEAEDLGAIDNDITVELTSMSPVAREQERANWLQFLQIATSPMIGALLSASPALLRKTAGLFDIHSERDLREVSKAMQAVMMMFAQGQAQKAGVSLPNSPAAGPTPGNGAIQEQLEQQLPVELMQGRTVQ